MYDTANASCTCTVGTVCSRTHCFCSGMCRLFAGEVADLKQCQAVTISPDPRTIVDYISMHAEWQEHFVKLRHVISDCIIVLELAGLRPHYHCVFTVKDPVGFNIKLLNLSKVHNIKKHNMFKEGLHYIFKEVDTTYEQTGILPVFIYEDIVQLVKNKDELKKARILSVRQSRIDDLNKEIPDWMLK